MDGWTAEISRGGSPRHSFKSSNVFFPLFFAKTNVISRETLLKHLVSSLSPRHSFKSLNVFFPLFFFLPKPTLFRERHYQRILYFRLQVVGSQARILYSDQRGRVALAQAFNKGISEGRLQVSTVFFSLKCTVRQILYIALGRINYQPIINARHKKPSRECLFYSVVRFFSQLC